MATIDEIRAVFEPMFHHLEQKIETLEAHHKGEIDRLREQSGEHYDAEKSIERAITERFEAIREQGRDSAERQGVRIGVIDGLLAEHGVRLKDVEDDIKENKAGSRFGKEMWILIALGLLSLAGVVYQVAAG